MGLRAGGQSLGRVCPTPVWPPSRGVGSQAEAAVKTDAMQVAIDVSSRQISGGGTTTYVNGLLDALQTMNDPRVEVFPICRRLVFNRRHPLFRRLDTLFFDLVWLPYRLPHLARRSGAALLHLPVPYTAPRLDMPIVTTVHDCYILQRPSAFTRWMAMRYTRTIPAISRRSDFVMAVSEFTRKEILRLIPEVDPARVVTVYPGIPEDVFREASVDEKTLRQKYGLDGRYALFVSTVEPRKNLSGAMAALAAADLRDVMLVVVGAPGWGGIEVSEVARRTGLEGRVTYLRYVPRSDLLSLYRAAELLIYPSFYEGFGYPVLEAMACGCPVVASNVASLPEVCGDAALLVSPRDVKEIGTAVLRIVREPSFRRELVSRGLEHVKRFTWTEARRKVAAVYEMAVAAR